MTPQSRLTAARPDIWQRGLEIASGLTGYAYAPKLPLADGTIYACGFYNPDPPDKRTPKEKITDEIKDHERQRDYWKGYEPSEFHNQQIRYHEEKIIELEKKRNKLISAPVIYVPEGAMEWLLHEIGHWLAASPEERALPNYGYDAFKRGSGHGDAREWQAWAFEEIVLAPHGQARNFTPSSYRGGTAFRKGEPIPNSAFAHIERRMRESHIGPERFRVVWEDWVNWGRNLGPEAPWLT